MRMDQLLSTNSHDFSLKYTLGRVLLNLPLLSLSFFLYSYRKGEEIKRYEIRERIGLQKNKIYIIIHASTA